MNSIADPDVHPREVTRHFRAAGVTKFAGAAMGKLKEGLAGDFRPLALPMFTRAALQVLLLRATAKRPSRLRTLEYSCEGEQSSSLEQWIRAPSGGVDSCMLWARCVKKKHRFGCQGCRGRFVLGLRRAGRAAWRLLSWPTRRRCGCYVSVMAATRRAAIWPAGGPSKPPHVKWSVARPTSCRKRLVF